MRLSFLLLSSALLFSLGSCIEHLITAQWVGPHFLGGNYKDDLVCCLPSRLTIEEDEKSGNLKAKFEYGDSNFPCSKLFAGQSQNDKTGTMIIYNQTTTYREKYVSETFKGENFYFGIGYDKSYTRPNLNFYSPGTACNVSMSSRSELNPKPAPTPVNNSKYLTYAVYMFVICFILVIFAIFNCHQKKQSKAIMGQESAPQYGQSLPVYNAPNQFSTGQVNINYGARF